MSEFSKAKVKRENFVSHNDKAINIVEELLRSKDRIKESFDSITTALGEIEDTKKKDSFLNSLVLQLAHSRDSSLIANGTHRGDKTLEKGIPGFSAETDLQ